MTNVTSDVSVTEDHGCVFGIVTQPRPIGLPIVGSAPVVSEIAFGEQGRRQSRITPKSRLVGTSPLRKSESRV